MNIRIWIRYKDSPVKLTINEDSKFRYSFWERTDEGYHSEYITIEVLENYVFRHTFVDSRDCDGRMNREHTVEVPISSLSKNIDDNGEIIYPQWEMVSSSQRDFSAEAAGY